MTEGTERPVAFTVDGVSKSYPGVTALDDVSLVGHAGEVLAICGANGAGKSTLARLLSGQEQPSAGHIHVAGSRLQIRNPHEAVDAGVLLMHQEPVVIDVFTVEENLWLDDVSASGRTHGWRLTKRGRARQTVEALQEVGLTEVNRSQAAAELGPGQRQMLALGRSRVVPHKILILDETTASTTEEHFKDVMALVEKEKAEGVSVIFVSHRMPEVFAMADRIAVLRNGGLVDVKRTEETDVEEILGLMIGEAVQAIEPPSLAEVAEQPVLLDVQGLAAGSARGIDFTVRAGEIVGLYGLVGSGRSSVLKSIGGHQPLLAGQVFLEGRDARSSSPRDALARGVTYLTEDRRKLGFLQDFTNGENVTLSTISKHARLGSISLAAERSRVAEVIERYQVKGGVDTMTRTLSGGNQQKVVLAKWLEAQPTVMLLDEPTKGIDVGARMNIYQIVRDLARNDKGVVVVTSEAEEALMLCHRVLVLRDGELVGEFESATSTTDDLARAAIGGGAL
ncbi:MAG: sugar ABC transporter ATP-binding protein [Propionibacteriaceae bacterium]